MIWSWTAWLLAIIVSFAALEGYALARGKLTLSRYTWRASLAWGPLPFVLGLIVGGLSVHFWWHWCPEFGSTNGRINLPSFISSAYGAERRDLTLHDPILTPGAVADLTTQEICERRWGRDARNVTAAMKREVFRRYGLSGNSDAACTPDAHGRRCEVDHLISRELGGADVIANLWPQPYGGAPWNAVRKDRIENRLHKEVCAGRITLDEAQREIATDYRVPYRRYFGEP